MFKNITINLSGPLCSCAEASLTWSVGKDTKSKSILSLRCSTCGTALVVPHNKFVAKFHLDKPYPGKSEKEPEDDKEKLTVLDGGKVIAFHKDEEEGDEDMS